ncbi:Hypothetical protein FKW44_004081 [Caligus rogercresseyi]|uniref:Transposase n=1 Tax=Caligus rogercresseyi TaxID=217165 RepID=A0A7T8HL26_CALRO|nr:Hypothetical protein FKW44_004081 [Caligus rogercresseyi]
MEKREAIVKLYQKGHSCRAIVEALKPMKVSKSNVSYTIQLTGLNQDVQGLCGPKSW